MMNTKEFEKSVTEYCESAGLLPVGGRVLCAVSGGADSVCLLTSLHGIGIPLVCAHFDHRLRGEESARDAEFVKKMCLDMGVEFLLSSGDVRAHAASKGIGIEEAARELRYAFLEQAAEKSGAARIATAHTADDNLETMLMNLARGAGSAGMSGIPPRRENIVRPLLFATRQQVEEYLNELGIKWVEDSTNASDDYSRNRIRHHAVPVLRDINTAAASNALETARLIREDDDFLCSLARQYLDDNDDAIDVNSLLALPSPVSSRVLRMASGTELSAGHVRALLRLCQSVKPSARLDLPGTQARREYGALVFSPPAEAKIPETIIKIGEKMTIPGTNWIISSKVAEYVGEINSSLNTFCFQIDTICGNMTVRQRAPGDRIRFLGKSHTSSLKKLFIDEKIPLGKRAGIPVLADENGPVAVYGFGISERHAARRGENAILIEIIEGE